VTSTVGSPLNTLYQQSHRIKKQEEETDLFYKGLFLFRSGEYED